MNSYNPTYSIPWLSMTCYRLRTINMVPPPSDLCNGNSNISWWRHEIETFSASLALCERKPPVTGGFHSQRPVMRSFDVSIDVLLNKRLSKQLRRWGFQTPSQSLWRQCNKKMFFVLKRGPGSVFPRHWHIKEIKWKITSSIQNLRAFILNKLLTIKLKTHGQFMEWITSNYLTVSRWRSLLLPGAHFTNDCSTVEIGHEWLYTPFQILIAIQFYIRHPWRCHQIETFSALLALYAGNSPHKGLWRKALMFTLICAWINRWVNNREAGDLRRHRAHYDVIVMDSHCRAMCKKL